MHPIAFRKSGYNIRGRTIEQTNERTRSADKRGYYELTLLSYLPGIPQAGLVEYYMLHLM
jgi:hypothetical protein